MYSTACDVYAIVKEDQISTTTTLCGGQSGRSQVYTSTTNSVQISFVHNDVDNEKYFLIEFEGKSINWSNIYYVFVIVHHLSSVQSYTQKRIWLYRISQSASKCYNNNENNDDVDSQIQLRPPVLPGGKR